MGARTPSDTVTILLYSVNGTGLGHLTRLMAIGGWLRKLLNGVDLKARIFFLSCSDADFLLARNGFPSFKLPSRMALHAAAIRGTTADQLIRDYAAATLRQLSPDILVVDTFPTGTYDELLPILGEEQVTKVFIYREQRADYVKGRPYDKLLANFDLIVVPHDEGSMDLGFEPPKNVQLSWSGGIVFGEREELWTKAKARKTLGVPRRKTVVYTTAGGGGDPEAARTFGNVLEAARGLSGLHLVVGAGPLGSQPALSGRDITWTRYYPISRLFRGFDFAVSSSGYNSVHEMLFFGLPAILYAQERVADDQWGRARQVADAGAALAVARPTVGSLRAAMRRMLKPELRDRLSRRASAMLPVNGARRAAEQVLSVALPRMLPGTEFAKLDLADRVA